MTLDLQNLNPAHYEFPYNRVCHIRRHGHPFPNRSRGVHVGAEVRSGKSSALKAPVPGVLYYASPLGSLTMALIPRL